MPYFGTINGVSITLTRHALSRMVEMGVSAEDFKQLLFEPEQTYTSKKYSNCFCHRHGKYSAALTGEFESGLTVITILYSTLSEWIKADKEGIFTDRNVRLDTGIPFK